LLHFISVNSENLRRAYTITVNIMIQETRQCELIITTARLCKLIKRIENDKRLRVLPRRSCNGYNPILFFICMSHANFVKRQFNEPSERTPDIIYPAFFRAILYKQRKCILFAVGFAHIYTLDKP